MGEFDKAIADCTEAIRLDPEYANAYSNRGIAYAKNREFDKAIADCTKAIYLDPKYAEAYYNRAIVYARSKAALDDVIADYTEAIRLNPQYAKAYYNRGMTYEAKGEYDQAIRDYSQGIALNPNNADSHERMILALIRQGRAKEAVSHYRQAVGLLDNQPLVLNNLAWILATHPDAEVRDGAEAVRLAERACELTQYKLPAMLDTLATAYAETGQFDQAVKTAQKAIQLAQAAGKETLAKDIQGRLDLYEAKRPYRESVSAEDSENLEPK